VLIAVRGVARAQQPVEIEAIELGAGPAMLVGQGGRNGASVGPDGPP